MRVADLNWLMLVDSTTCVGMVFHSLMVLLKKWYLSVNQPLN